MVVCQNSAVSYLLTTRSHIDVAAYYEKKERPSLFHQDAKEACSKSEYTANLCYYAEGNGAIVKKNE